MEISRPVEQVSHPEYSLQARAYWEGAPESEKSAYRNEYVEVYDLPEGNEVSDEKMIAWIAEITGEDSMPILGN